MNRDVLTGGLNGKRKRDSDNQSSESLNSFYSSDIYHLLMRAVISGKIECVKQLIDAGIDINGLNSKYSDLIGDTALHEAVREGHLEMVQLLLSSGASINTQNWYRNTPIIIAAQIGRKDIAQKLIESEANVNDQNQFGDTSLHYAVRNDDLEMIKLLLSAGASPDVANNRGIADTPLLLALKSCTSTKEFYGKPILDIPEYNHDPRYNGAIETINSMQRVMKADEKKVDGQIPQTGTSFTLEVPQKKFDAARILLKAGASPDIPDVFGNLPLRIAIQSGKIDLVQLLVEAGANLNLSVEARLRARMFVTPFGMNIFLQ
ncbi:hypothetical protein QAD02_000165, partial [Eretmocerus hayati]